MAASLRPISATRNCMLTFFVRNLPFHRDNCPALTSSRLCDLSLTSDGISSFCDKAWFTLKDSDPHEGQWDKSQGTFDRPEGRRLRIYMSTDRSRGHEFKTANSHMTTT